MSNKYIPSINNILTPEFIEEIQKGLSSNGIFYIKGDPENPVENDWRIRADGVFLYDERYNSTLSQWDAITTIGASIETDRFIINTLFGGLFFDDPNTNERFNLARPTTRENGFEYGDMRSKLILTGNKRENITIGYNGTSLNENIEILSTNLLTNNEYTITFLYNGAEVMSLLGAELKVDTEIKGSMSIIDSNTGRISYLTMSDAEYLHDGGVLLKDKDTSATTGDISVDLLSIGFLIPGSTYDITIKFSEGALLGSVSFPYLKLVGEEQLFQIVADRDWVSGNPYFKGRLDIELTGTVTVSQNSTSVIGTDTLFSSELNTDDSVKIGNEIFTINSITDDTHLTLDSNHTFGVTDVKVYTDDDLVVIKDGDGKIRLRIDKSGVISPSLGGRYLGVFANLLALQTIYPTATIGDTATVTDPTSNLFYWDGSSWDDSGTGYMGDMLKTVFDPTGVNDDAFNMNNMVETIDKKVLTNIERTNILANNDKTTNATHTGEVTGDSNLIINSVAISNKTESTSTSDMDILVNDSGTLKKVKVGDFIDGYKITKEPTGFLVDDLTGEINLSESEFSFANNTRAFTIKCKAPETEFSIVQDGKIYTFDSNQDIIIDDIEGLHYIYFDNGILISTNIFDINLIYSKVLVSILYWDKTNQKQIYLAEERHGCKMDGHTHARLHQKDGSIYLNGLGLNDFVIDDGNADEDAQFSIAYGNIKDEDILLNLSNITKTVGLPIFYREDSSNWRREFNSGFSVLNSISGDNRLVWNENIGGSWQKTEVSDNDYVLCHIFATNDITYPFFSIIGQNEYDKKSKARDGAETELNNLILNGLPFVEFVAVGTIIFQTKSTYTNFVKAKVITNDDGGNYIDWRFSEVSRNGISTLDHNNLGGLQGGTTNEYYHLTEEEKIKLVYLKML